MVLKEIQNECKHKGEHLNYKSFSHSSLVSETQNLGMSCNLTDILLIKDFSLDRIKEAK